MAAAPVFSHLARLTTSAGLFEHSLHSVPRPEHGYCLDDVARGLVVVAREPHPSPTVARLERVYLRFVLTAQDESGRFRNRRAVDGRWTDEPGVGDHWGRALWALGTVAATRPDAEAAVQAATLGLAQRSPWWHSMAYAALGAAELVRVRPGHDAASGLLDAARSMLGLRVADESWPWPDPRLTYANAVLPEALIAIGVSLEDDATVNRGVELLEWLFAVETQDGRLSPTPHGGSRPGAPRPGFDQQPIEVAALAEACTRAFHATGDQRWLTRLDLCVAWFHGVNDLGLPLYDPATGAGHDGLHADRVNQNQGAESTLAALATIQLAQHCGLRAVS